MLVWSTQTAAIGEPDAFHRSWSSSRSRATGAYREAFELLHRHEADRPNAVCQADHAQLDLRLATNQRPWLTVVLDDHNRCVAGYSLSLTAPSGVAHFAGTRPSHLAQTLPRPLRTAFQQRNKPQTSLVPGVGSLRCRVAQFPHSTRRADATPRSHSDRSCTGSSGEFSCEGL